MITASGESGVVEDMAESLSTSNPPYTEKLTGPQPVLVHGARSSWDQVQQAGRGMFLPSCQVRDAGEFTWAPAASVLVVPHVLIDSQYLNPCETGGVIRCGLQTRLDMGPHGIPRGCQLSSQASDSGSLETQLSEGPQARPGCARDACAHPALSSGSPDAPWGRTSARHVPGMSPSGRCAHGISSVA